MTDKQLNLLQLNDEPEVGDYIMTPEGRGKVEGLWHPGNKDYMWDDRSMSIPEETCVAVRYRSHSWNWFLLSELSEE